MILLQWWTNTDLIIWSRKKKKAFMLPLGHGLCSACLCCCVLCSLVCLLPPRQQFHRIYMLGNLATLTSQWELASCYNLPQAGEMHVNLGLDLELCPCVSMGFTHGETLISFHRGHLIPMALQELIAILQHLSPCFISSSCSKMTFDR